MNPFRKFIGTVPKIEFYFPIKLATFIALMIACICLIQFIFDYHGSHPEIIIEPPCKNNVYLLGSNDYKRIECDNSHHQLKIDGNIVSCICPN